MKMSEYIKKLGDYIVIIMRFLLLAIKYGVTLMFSLSWLLILVAFIYFSLSDILHQHYGGQWSETQRMYCDIGLGVVLLLLFSFVLWKVYVWLDIDFFGTYTSRRNRKETEKAQKEFERKHYRKINKETVDVRTAEELLEVFKYRISVYFWGPEWAGKYLDFTKKEIRKEIPMWNKDAEKSMTACWGEDENGIDKTYRIHFKAADWERFSQLYDQYRKEQDNWAEWWGDRWLNLYASIVADSEVLERVFLWCQATNNKRKKAASTYLREVFDLMRKGDDSTDESGSFVVYRWRDNCANLINKRFTTAEDMLRYMEVFFEIGFWQGEQAQTEYLGDSYRDVLTDCFNATQKDNPGMSLDLPDAEWKRLKDLFPQLVKEDEMRECVFNTLQERIGCVIDEKLGHSAKTVIVHDMLEPFV